MTILLTTSPLSSKISWEAAGYPISVKTVLKSLITTKEICLLASRNRQGSTVQDHLKWAVAYLEISDALRDDFGSYETGHVKACGTQSNDVVFRRRRKAKAILAAFDKGIPETLPKYDSLQEPVHAMLYIYNSKRKNGIDGEGMDSNAILRRASASVRDILDYGE